MAIAAFGSKKGMLRSRADTPADRGVLRVAFVNNMPDAAFEDTHRQFEGLIRSSSGQLVIELRCYRIPGVPRGDAVRRTASAAQMDVGLLYTDPPDVLVITGAEPTTADLTSEPYWESLAHLLRWAEATVPSTMLSCLAAHAAVLALDGINRSKLPVKQSGVFPQRVNRFHPLGRGLGPKVAFPHSRLNEVPTRALTECGYALVVESEESGWTVAARERQGRILVLLQGHPEYAPTTLLREYRRDIRRFARGSLLTYPEVPSHYVDRGGVDLLEAIRAAKSHGPRGASGDGFPFDAAARHVVAGWEHASVQFFANWMIDAHRRATKLSV